MLMHRKDLAREWMGTPQRAPEFHRIGDPAARRGAWMRGAAPGDSDGSAAGRGGRTTARAVSAGLLLYRRTDTGLEVLLAHPGGPFWSRRDAGAWTIPKGTVEPGEDPLAAARREFEEETGFRPAGPFLPLGEVRQKAGKVVRAWAWEGDADPAAVRSNTVHTEWPRGSGRWLTFPEVDRCAWYAPAQARKKINPAQAELLERLEAALAEAAGG
jgi:predicted NUDIX family NTP pyrophosphohydrolase